jgi:4-amino-4-deoxy-L-arabinose transferase-like glycosyltransferase
MFLGIDRRLSKRHPLSTSLTFLLCWIGVQVGVFSLVATKLPSYVTPCFPALALCCGSYLDRWAREKDRLPQFWDKAVYAAIGVTGACISIALAIACAKFLHGSFWLAALGVPWVAVAGYGLFLPSNHRPRHWVAGFALCALGFSVALFGFGAPSVARLQQTQRLLDPVRQLNVPVATYKCLESSWVYYAGQPIHELATSEQTADAPEQRIRYWQKKPRLLPAEFARQHPGAFVITTEQAWQELQSQLPGEYQILAFAPYFLRDKNLVLAGPADAVRMANASPSTNRR